MRRLWKITLLGGMMSAGGLALLLSVQMVTAQGQPKSTYEAVLAGKACREEEQTQRIECEYKVGKGLHLIISGLGQPDTGVIFLKSSQEEDYYGSFGVLHGCVIISRSADEPSAGKDSEPDAAIAFISPKNGKVYRVWEECRDGW